MVTKRTVWEESMARRCLDRVTRGFVPAYVHEERNLTRSFQAGEWDDFRRKLTKETKK
jgi:hypothetical protein